MKFLLSSIGSSGDVYPMIAMGKELRRRGFQATLATNGHFRRSAEENGLKFIELGTEDDYFRVMQNPDLWHPRRSFSYMFAYVQHILKEQHRILVESHQHEPTCGIASTLSFGSLMARETHHVPVFSLHLQPAVIWSYIRPPNLGGISIPDWFKRRFFDTAEKWLIDRVVGRFLNPWRAEYGLPAMSKTTRWWNSPDGVVCLFPEWYAQPQSDWPSPLIQTDFPLWNYTKINTVDSGLQNFLQSSVHRPVVFTPGSANVHNIRFFQAAVEGCRRLEIPAVLVSPHQKSWPTHLPRHVFATPYTPLHELLPHAAALVHHGGIGTMSQAFLAGIPQIIKPMAHDQFDNANRVQKLKLGLSLSVRKFTARNLAKILDQVINDPEIQSECQAAQQRVLPRMGVHDAVTGILERLGQPSTLNSSDPRTSR